MPSQKLASRPSKAERDVDPQHGKAAPQWFHLLFSLCATGLICGLLAVMFSISAAALLFSSELSGHVGIGIGICLIGTIALNVIIALFSSHPGMISVTQEVTVIALAIIGTSIHGVMFDDASEAEILTTIIVMIGVTTSVTGLVLYTMGTLRLGQLIRFIPYPVIAGFLAGMGWLIVSGAIAVVLGFAMSDQTVLSLLQPATVSKLLPAMIFALVLGVMTQRFNNPLILPAAIVASLVTFHSCTAMLELSVSQLQQHGWLFEPPQRDQILLPIHNNPIAMADWEVILAEAPKMIMLIVINAFALLFASTGIGLAVKRDIDLDQELRVAGIANVCAGIGGGSAGFQGLGLTILAHKMGAPYRIVGLLVAGICAIVLFFGADILNLFPIPLFGGLLLWIGGTLIYEWLVSVRLKMSRAEYLIVLIIFILIATIGLIEGVLAGVVAVLVLFAAQYARQTVIKHIVTAGSANLDSNCPEPSANLCAHETVVFRLKGYVFFGNVHRLHQTIVQHVDSNNESQTRRIVLDFRDVTGFDASARATLAHLSEVLEKKNALLIVRHCLRFDLNEAC